MQIESEFIRTGPSIILAFLQARMGSSRLPGKVLTPIQGKSILARAVSRLQAVPEIDAVAVLTTKLAQDDCVAEEACRLGALVHRGSELDVLDRFEEASQKFKPGIIIRATADNPLIDIGSVSRIVNELRSENLDYCMEINLPYGAATEACTASALAKTNRLAGEPRYREHVTLQIKEHPEEFRIAFLEAPASLRYPDLRITVDTPEDLAFMSKLLACISEGESPVPLSEYIHFGLGMLQASH
jgi:spore coat polysaccharide biosynthesis protein SpsF